MGDVPAAVVVHLLGQQRDRDSGGWRCTSALPAGDDPSSGDWLYGTTTVKSNPLVATGPPSADIS